MPCGATQDRRAMVERSDRMSTGEENGKPLQYSCLENPMNSMIPARLTMSNWCMDVEMWPGDLGTLASNVYSDIWSKIRHSLQQVVNSDPPAASWG